MQGLYRKPIIPITRNLNIDTDEFEIETRTISPPTSPRTVIVTETNMIETVATQDEMAQQTSLLNHSKESDQQGNGDNYQNTHGSTTTLELTAISDDGKAETIYHVSESPLQNPSKQPTKEPRKSVKANVPTHKQ